MPKIILPNGSKYKYRLIPLYPGVKKIDKVIASENLNLLKAILDDKKIFFQLTAGTVLGVIREKDFIDHDEDIDIAFRSEDKEKVLNLLPHLREYGFELCRYDRRDLYSIIRKGEYIDLYFFRPYKDNLQICSGWIIKESHLLENIEIKFKDNTYLIPKDYEEFLIEEYGYNWQKPIVWNNYNQSKIKVLFFTIKEYIKLYLPKALFNRLVSHSEKKMIEKSYLHLRRIGIVKIN